MNPPSDQSLRRCAYKAHLRGLLDISAPRSIVKLRDLGRIRIFLARRTHILIEWAS